MTTTQYDHMTMSSIPKKHCKSPFTEMNLHRHEVPVVTDTIYSDAPSNDYGYAFVTSFRRK